MIYIKVHTLQLERKDKTTTYIYFSKPQKKTPAQYETGVTLNI